MSLESWFQPRFVAHRPPIFKVKVLNYAWCMGTCYGEEKSGFPVQPEEKIRKNRVFWSTYRESSYHTFDNSVVRHIRCLPRNLNGIFSSQMVKRSMGEPFWKGRLNGLIRLVNNKDKSNSNLCYGFTSQVPSSRRVFSTISFLYCPNLFVFAWVQDCSSVFSAHFTGLYSLNVTFWSFFLTHNNEAFLKA